MCHSCGNAQSVPSPQHSLVLQCLPEEGFVMGLGRWLQSVVPGEESFHCRSEYLTPPLLRGETERCNYKGRVISSLCRILEQWRRSRSHLIFVYSTPAVEKEEESSCPCLEWKGHRKLFLHRFELIPPPVLGFERIEENK